MPFLRGDKPHENFYYLKPNDLSIMTNHIESRLGSRISDSSALEFVLYVPPKEPLFIRSEQADGGLTKVNAFLVPRWGGVYIYNHGMEQSKTIKLDEAMKIYLTQFIELFGVKLNNINGLIRSRIFTTEMHDYLLRKTIGNLLTSINTLKSLSLLLTRIQEMVIEDHIAEQVGLK